MKHVKLIAAVTAGVFLAGFVMNAARDVDIVKDAIKGFDS